MVLGDREIKNAVETGRMKIFPFREENVGPVSYDVTLGNEFVVYRDVVLRYDKRPRCKTVRLNDGDKVMIIPKGKVVMIPEDVDYAFRGGVIGMTNEYVELGNDICAQFQGRSSMGRMFLTVHQTAGWIDAGFRGNIVLEIIPEYKPVVLTVGDRIGQLIFFDCECEKGYNGKYQDQRCVGYIPDNEVKE